MCSLIGNGRLVGQYTDSLETQHAYIKDAVDVTFPQNIKTLQAVLEKVREKIQRLEKAITTQRAKCQVPCKVSCPIPVVSGKECEEIIRKGGEDSQMYLIRPDPLSTPYKVFCDQTSQKGGMSTSFKQTPDVTQDLKIMWPIEESHEKHPTQIHWENVAVATFLQNDIMLLESFAILSM